MGLLATYEGMKKEAEALSVQNEKVAALVEYATLAENALVEECGEGNYDADEVIKVASAMIDHDLDVLEKEASLEDLEEQSHVVTDAFFSKLASILEEEQN